MPELAKVLKLPGAVSVKPEQAEKGQALASLGDKQRHIVILRWQLVMLVLAEREAGDSIRVAARNLIAAIETGQASEATIAAAKRLAKGGKATPSHQALERWVSAYCRHGLDGLIPKHKGSERQAYGWEARALSLYQRPVKAAMSTVAYWLQQEGFDTATISRVRRYLKSLPTQLSSHAPKRVGPHYYRQNLTPYVVRDASVLPVGFVYEGDGHCCDVHIAHPQTGKATRPELTVWLDVRSHYCVGWWLSDAERASDTLFSLSHAIVSHDHVPAMIHVDPGSGYKNKLIQGEAVSYCERLSIEFMTAHWAHPTIYTLALETRSSSGPFAASAVLIDIWMVTQVVLNEGGIFVNFASVIDPSRFGEVNRLNKACTPNEKATIFYPLKAPFILNRPLWGFLPLAWFVRKLRKATREALIQGKSSAIINRQIESFEISQISKPLKIAMRFRRRKLIITDGSARFWRRHAGSFRCCLWERLFICC